MKTLNHKSYSYFVSGVMKKSFLSLNLLSSLVFISNAQAVYVLDDGKIDYKQICRKTTDHFPAVCLIEGSQSKGTGTLVAPNVVLTCRHTFVKNSTLLEPASFTVQTFDKLGSAKLTKVKKIEIFLRASELTFASQGKEDDVAILILEDAIKDVTPATVKSITKDSQLDSIWLMGFGGGGLLSDKPSEIDGEDFYNLYFKNKETPLFRLVKEQKGSFNLQFSAYKPSSIKIEINSKIIKLGHGDSGGAVLDQDGHIVGINIEGIAKGFRFFDAEMDSTLNAVKSWQENQVTEYIKRLDKHVEDYRSYLAKREEINRETLLERYIRCFKIWLNVSSSPITTLVEPQAPEAPSVIISFEEFMNIFSENRMKTTETIKTFLNNGKVLGSTALGIDQEMYDWIQRTIQDAAPKDGKTEVTN